MKIAVLDDYPDAFRTGLAYPKLSVHEVVIYRDTEKDPTKLASRLKDAEAVVLTQQRTYFPRAVIEKLPKLRFIAQTGGHRDHIDIAACNERGIVISRGYSSASYATAELTWGLIMAAMRSIPQEMEALKKGAWQSTIGRELCGLTLGVYGMGRIGTRIAHYGAAFGMKVICWGRSASQQKARAAGYEVPASRGAFFEQADVLSLNLFYCEETHGIVTAADLARMKPDALLVNSGRAKLIADGALLQALKNGRPGLAAVDVYEDEPVLGGDHPLLSMPNVVCTPHLGYCVRGNYDSFYSSVIDNLLAFAAGKPAHVMNPEALAKR